MIGRLQGTLLEKTFTGVLLDVGGIGYEVEIPGSTYEQLGDRATLHCHLVIREDRHELYGFATRSGRDMFRALIRVNKVGPKLAISILSGLEPAALARCVVDNDVRTLQAVPGVGKKTAERLIIDLRDVVGAFAATGDGASPTRRRSSAFEDAETALIQLGFKPAEAARAVGQVEDPSDDAETLIRAALQTLSQVGP